jgi:Cu/Ag efflux protein CusF
MTRSILLLFAALALTATTAAAQGDVRGTVKYVDPSNRMVYLTDGRSLKIEPGSKILIDGREVTLDALKPGTPIVLAAAPMRPASTPMTLASHPPINATGVVASVDNQTGVITLQDGRKLKATEHTFVWQPTQVGDLKPGEKVYLHDARPVIALTPGQTSSPIRMGTVVNVDPANALVMLNDGTLVRVMPATKMHMRDTTLTLSDLRPGDEVVITTRPSTAVAPGGSAVSALPRAALGHVTVDASDIQVVRGLQAP